MDIAGIQPAQIRKAGKALIETDDGGVVLCRERGPPGIKQNVTMRAARLLRTLV